MCSMSCRVSTEEEISELTVFAAVSLADVILSKQEYFQNKENVELTFNFAGSQVLASQIANGAPADIFISAGAYPVKYLLDKNFLFKEDIEYLASNKLVIAISKNYHEIDVNEVEDLKNVKRLAIADPEYAPAGMYAKQALNNLQLEEMFGANIIMVANARSALTYLETKNVDAAILYKTDAMSSDKVIEVDVIPTSSYSSIIYPIAFVRSSGNVLVANKYIEYLLSEDFKTVLYANGFGE